MNKKQFSALEKHWYAKLKSEGFKEIEQDSKYLIKHHDFARSGVNIFKSKELYYQLAGQFLHEYAFDKEINKTMWDLHSQGRTYREISKKIEVFSKSQIFKVIKNLKEIMLKKHSKDNNE